MSRSSLPVRGRMLLSPLAILAMLLVNLAGMAQPAQAASPNIVISQVYGGGGNSGATYTNDFVELYNRGNSLVDITGWSVQYASAAGTTWQKTALSGLIAPGKYYLVQEAQGAGGTTALPTPDASGNIAMSGTAGKVALVNNTTTLAGTCPTTGVVDFVGYGSATCFEGSAAAGLSNTTAALRAGNGATDTDNNASDFKADAPTPRNSSYGDLSGTGAANPNPVIGGNSTLLTVDVTPGSNPTSSGLTVSADLTTIGGSATQQLFDDATNGDTTAGDNTFSYNVAVAASTTPGGKSLPVSITDAQSRSAGTTIALTVSANPCLATLTPIYTIQGSDTASRVRGQTVTLKGVVTGDFQGSGEQSGFYLQDPTGDSDALTSDGIFVFVPSANALSTVDVTVGDSVAVTGRVAEFNTLTEIDNVTALNKCDTSTPLAPTVVQLPETTNGDLERYEGMLVTFNQTLTVQQNFFQGRYGQVTLASGGRLFQPTNLYDANSDQAQQEADSNARSLIVLDDGRSSQNPNPIPYVGDNLTLRAGDTTSSLTGVLDFGPINSDISIRDYRIQPTAPVSFTRINDRTTTPEPVGSTFKVAAFNVLNYFTTIDQSGAQCFPSNTRSDCRGADSTAEFTRQRDKIIAAIIAIDPAVAGLMEIENNGDTAAQNLVDGLNSATAPDTYALITTPKPGTDAIKVAMIYQPARVTPVGDAVNYQVSDPVYGDALFDRPPLAQTFADTATGATFTVIVNHFKSKGSCPSSGPDANQGDGQSCWNAKRVRQAEELLDFTAERQTASGDLDVLVIGDLNAYAMEDPIQVLTAGGLVNEIEKLIGDQGYSYVFDGMSGYLDHALATPSLDRQITGVTEWHINADEPSVIDYNTEFKPQDLYTATPYRASDHDPVVVGLNLIGFRGFVKPIENLPVVNSVKAGSVVPATFSLGGDRGLDIFATGYPKTQAVSCEDTNTRIGDIESTVTSGGSSLAYDPATDLYIYVWKTNKTWTGCRQLIVRLYDGTERYAFFQFK